MLLPSARHVLIIEDDPVEIRLLKRTLRSLKGTRFSWATTLEQGLAQLAAHHFSAVITDLGLPGLAELEAVEAIRDAAPSLPMVVLTQHDDALAVRAIQLGAQEWLGKSEVTASLLSRALRCAMVRKEAELDLQRRVYYDSLTGLLNKPRFTTLLRDRIRDAPERPFTVLFLDLDRFKQVNDRHGHHAGDTVLSTTGQRLQALPGAAARLSGDEFALLVEEENGQIVSSIRAAITAPIRYGARSLSVGVSVGAAYYPAHGTTAEALLQRADHAMYEDKRQKPAQLRSQEGVRRSA